MLISNSAVHEIDVARWLLNDEFTSATVFRRTARGSTALVDPQFIVLETRTGVLVDIEVFVNAQYGYDVRAEMVCESGSVTLEPRSPVRVRSSGQEGRALPTIGAPTSPRPTDISFSRGSIRSGAAFRSERALGTDMSRQPLRQRALKRFGAAGRRAFSLNRVRGCTIDRRAGVRRLGRFKGRFPVEQVEEGTRMSRSVSWGVLSTARIGTEKVIPAMQRGELSRIDAIGSRDIARGREIAARLGIPKAYGSYEEPLADPSITAVYNPLPNHLHVPWTIKAMEAGKHVSAKSRSRSRPTKRAS